MTRADDQQPAILVHLMGGLGNQLFQYAFGRRLALHNSAQLWLDTSGYHTSGVRVDEDAARTVGLSHFRIVGQLTDDPFGDSGDRLPVRRWVRKVKSAAGWIADQAKPYFRRRQVVEPANRQFNFDDRLLELKVQGMISVRGFWQSEAYFLDAEELIRRELVVRDELRGKNAETARRIQAAKAAAIHVRHGDNAGALAADLGVLPREYYVRAMAELRREAGAIDFFVFSDDVPWSRQLLPDDVPMCFVDHNGASDSHEDLRLMTLCRHHILANSTFGWWGAWLAKSRGQVVMAPRRYFQGVDRPNPDLYPARWRLL